MNFFSWIRTGVRQAVLLGVNDAVDTIGEPTENSKFREELTLAIEQGDQQALPAKKGSRKSSAPRSFTERRRAGRQEGRLSSSDATAEQRLSALCG